MRQSCHTVIINKTFSMATTSKKERFMDTTLKEASLSVIMKGLSNIGTGRFTCGGTLQTPSTVQLAYVNKSGQWSGVTFPGLKDSDFQQILETSKVASFGKGKEEVTDKSIRDAYVLETDKYLSSFQLSDTGILEEIRALLAPDVASIRTELYKMNIYTSPTGCFKPHVDTPRAGNMFGSLVVCLPSQFSGGALVARHNGQQVTYDWSSSAANPAHKIQWAAFFSDVEHEILPVTEGHRVTLTYNLYHCNKQLSLELNVVSPFYNKLKAAIDHPHFMRDGGILGFGCQHAYIFEEFNYKSGNHLFYLLKGSDREVFSAANLLDLEVKIKPIVKGEWTDHVIGTYFGFKESESMHMGWDEYFKEEGFDEATSIEWCQPIEKEQQWQPSIVAMHYGNDPSLSVCYQAAAILITIPQWGKRQTSSDLKTET